MVEVERVRRTWPAPRSRSPADPGGGRRPVPTGPRPRKEPPPDGTRRRRIDEYA